MFKQMTLKEKIQECLACFFFLVFMTSCVFLISISDTIDQAIIEHRQSASEVSYE